MLYRKLVLNTLRLLSIHQFQPKPILSSKNANAIEKDKRFVNDVTIKVQAGKGGNGIACFSGIFMKAFAGPDGGNGGKGGDVILEASRKVCNLNHVRDEYRAANGLIGGSARKTGKSGKATIIQVPLRTRIRESNDGQTIGLLEKQGEKFIVAYGGSGGRGNAEFLTNENRAPDIYELGEHGQALAVQLEMDKFADFGIVGIPNAGKSSFLRVVSRAYPRIADYPFTTLFPQIGVVEYTDHCVMSLAEIPGLIEGSSFNKGHGRFFLKHARGCDCILFMIDLKSEMNPIDQLDLLMSEFDAFDSELLKKKAFMIAANKIDSPDGAAVWPYFKNIMSKRMPEVLCVPTSVRERINIIKLLMTMRLILDQTVSHPSAEQILQPLT
ncbi:hypothetical protein GJ496_002409 [Pomphorhynchus laevis]|nr:hypothetical protein GJ496_002409 [Pomphorhynchus laevis]